MWIDEAQRRYDAYLKATAKPLPGDEVMNRARKRTNESAIASSPCRRRDDAASGLYETATSGLGADFLMK